MELETTSPELIVCQALRAATDPNHEVVRKAEVQLVEWELQPGFFPTMVRIFQNPQLDVNVRWMAAVYLKNGVNKYWRRNMKNELSAEEKQQIRQLLLSNFNEPIPQVALQIAVLVAKIARIDCPRDWPQLMPQLLKALQESSDQLQQQRVLLVLYHVVKALASKRMMADKRVFEELTANIYSYIYELWDGFTQLYFHQLNSGAAPELTISTLEKALLTLRILRKLTIFGFNKPHTSEQCMQFVELLFARLKQCLECRYELQRLQAHENLLALTEKFILKQMKILNEFLDMHGGSFTRFVPTALEFSFNYVFHEGAYLIFSNNVMNFRHFAIHCINLMKGILLRNNDSIPGILTEFFSSERLCYICEKIMTHYFLLTQIELDLWTEDPEGFAQDDGGESWRYSLRPCVEALFLTLMPQFQKEWSAEVVKYISKAQQIELSADSDIKDLLLKDAIYNAAGVASFYLFNDIDFDVWFSTQLLAELKIECNNFRILRRRIIWLVSQWAGVKLARELRPVAYEACLHLLRPAEDMSIRLAASKTLYRLIIDFDFAPETFLPYLEVSFSSLFVLLREAKECDTKMNVLTSMSLIVEKMGDHIEPQADNLINYLPMLWKESESYNLLRCAIICTLQQLVKAIRDIPEPMKPFLYSVIELSTNLQEPSHIYLMEEGLTLWLAVVEDSTVLTPKLFELCQILLPIIEMSSENLRIVLVVIQAYILLDAHTYLERYGRAFVEFCARMFDDIRPEGCVLMLKVLETCLKTDPNYGLELVRPALPYIFKQVYANKQFPMLMSMYLMMVARVLLINQSVFMQIVQEIQEPNPLETILDVWITKMPLVSEVEKRKLFCLAFCSIFSNNAVVLERFPGIMQNISETLNEVMREEEDTDDVAAACGDAGGGDEAAGADAAPKTVSKVKYCDSLVFIDEHDLDTSSYCTYDDFDYKNYHYDRCRQLSLKDPVHKIVLTDYIEWQLSALRTQLGDVSYQQLMQTVYSGVLEKMSEYVQLGINFAPTY